MYLGFSQGVSTLIRWMTNIHPRCNHLLLWAGSIPEDILLEPHQSYFGSMATHYFIGKSDPYYKEDRSNEIEQLLKQAGMRTQLQWFDGTHKIEGTVLQQWVKKYLVNE
jgi:predicted esterase